MFRSYEINGNLVRVRTTSGRFALWLDEVLAEYSVPHDPDVHGYSYSIVIPVSGGSAKQYNILYAGRTSLVRSFHLVEVGRSLLLSLESAFYAHRDDAVYVAAGLMRVNGRVALANSSLVAWLGKSERRMLRAGFWLPATLEVAVDPADGRVVPITPRLNAPGDALVRLAEATGSRGQPDRWVVAEPVTVDLVVGAHIAWKEEPVKRVSRGLALARLGASVANLPTMGRRALEGLAKLVGCAECCDVVSVEEARTVEALHAVARGEF